MDSDGGRVSQLEPSALVVVDVQAGFDDKRWGPRNNPRCERNVSALLQAWRRQGWPVVLVRHNASDPESPSRQTVQATVSNLRSLALQICSSRSRSTRPSTDSLSLTLGCGGRSYVRLWFVASPPITA